MTAIVLAALSLGVLGLLFGLGLGLAAKKFYVQVDSRLEKIIALLPGANCGACGKAGCVGFAESLILGQAGITQCAVSTEETREKICKILKINPEKKAKRVAVLHCRGGNKVVNRFVYRGLKDCLAASLMLGGQKACLYGCLGFGNCVRVCPFGALSMGQDGLPVVDEKKCRACGKCVVACPKKLFSLQDVNFYYFVACKSFEIGKKVLDVCKVGCIACGRCQKVCPVSAISVVNNLAQFDYQKCQNNGECFKVCPTKAIVKR